MKEITIKMSNELYTELLEIASENRITLEDLLRTGVGLIRVAYETKKEKKALAVINPETKAIESDLVGY